MSFCNGISWLGTRHRQGLWPRINCSQMKLPDFESPSSDSLSKSANFGLSKWIFYVKNHPNLSKKIFTEEYQFRSTFFVKSIFADFNFKTTLFTKMTPNLGNFIRLQLILGQKPCFLGPIQLVRQKVNIH